MCSAARDNCHFFSWDKENGTCELGYMDLGWHFNYTDGPDNQKQVSVNTGTCNIILMKTQLIGPELTKL